MPYDPVVCRLSSVVRRQQYREVTLVVFIIALILLVGVMGYLDSRIGFPKPTEKISRYVSLSERSKTLKRD
jgi:hypothetical protein